MKLCKIGPLGGQREAVVRESVFFVAGIVLAASAGGGEVRVPAGDHRIGGVPLRSGVTLHLEKDAHLVDAMIAGREPKKAREMFVDFYANASNLVFKANPDFWGAKLDFSCFPVWNTSKEPHSHGGTLISPWHVLFSKHWYLGKGNALYFRDRAGKVLKRDIVDVRHVGGTDLTVGLLREPVNGIEPARVLATNEISRLSKGEPVVVINQDKYATIADLRGFGAKTDPLKAAKFGFDRSHDRQREGFFVRVRSNDSSSPSFLVDEKGLVLVGLHWEVGEDANITAFTPVIQKLMDELHPGCSLRYR